MFKGLMIVLILITLILVMYNAYKKNIKFSLLSLLILVILGFMYKLPLNANKSSSKASNVINIATEGAYKPWNYISAKGTPEGFDVDVAKAVANKLGMKINIIVTPWESLIPNLMNKQVDAIVSSLSITENRKKSVDFSDPYAAISVSFFGSKKVFMKNETSSVEDIKVLLKNKVIGVQRSTTPAEYIEKNFNGISKVKYYDTQDQLMLDVKSGRIDAGFSEIPSVSIFIRSNPDIIFFGSKLGMKDSPLFGEGVAIAINKKNTDLKEKINVALKQLRDEGTIKDLSIKYFGTDISY